MEKILVIGCAGFIGSNLSKELIKNGYKVIGVDNFSYGNLENIKPLLETKQFEFIQEDARNYEILKPLKADILVHLASQKIPRYNSALRTLEENQAMLKNMIKKCNEDKIKLVFASTSDIYGKNPDLPYHEESNIVLGPTTVKRWAYALSKIYGEQLIIANNAEFDLEYTIMRFFGSYGPNQNTTWWGGPQAVFIQNILEDKPLEIHGDGLQTRTFTYVEDTVQGIIKCTLEPKAKNEIFNVANHPDEEITILDLAKLIWQLMKGENSEPDIKMIPYESFGKYEDVLRRVPSIKKIKDMLYYLPKTSIREGMQKTIHWQKSRNILQKV